MEKLKQLYDYFIPLSVVFIKSFLKAFFIFKLEGMVLLLTNFATQILWFHNL